MLPAGADAVAMQEDVQLEHDHISISPGITTGLNVRPRGEQLHAGAVALGRGRRLRSYDLGLAAAAGASELLLVRRLRVGVLSTGDELQDPPRAAVSAAQFDGNRPTLCAALGKGNRPSFEPAAEPARAEPLYLRVADGLRAAGLAVETGRFGADMAVELVNDGPVTFWIETRDGALVK